MSWLFLTAALIGAWFTFNAYMPMRRPGWVALGSFFAGWLTSELWVQHIAWQALATVLFIALGALEAWPGWVAVGVTAVSWLAMYRGVRIAHAAQHC